MATSWEEYLNVPEARKVFRDRFEKNERAFGRQRDILRDAIATLRPKQIVCLGAGTLSDIPFDKILEIGAGLHLVDWLPESIDIGLAARIIRDGKDGDLACLFCALGEDRAREHCQSYEKSDARRPGLCDNYLPEKGAPRYCLSYRRGSRPEVSGQDVTAGYAEAFAKGVLDALDGVTSWRQALKRAAALAERVESRLTSLDIADHSADLVISSLVISQFEHEPYTYFSRQAAALLGPPTPAESKRLRPAMERLRNTLTKRQLIRHCDEIARILTPDGHCIMSFELFHFDAGTDGWFLVEQMHRGMALIAERLRFNFDILPAGDKVAQLDVRGGRSMIYTFALDAPAHSSSKDDRRRSAP